MTTTGMPLDTNRFRFLGEALDGAGGFLNGEHIVRYPRESEKKYTARKALAWYTNSLRPACTRFVGYIQKKPTTREINHPLLEAFYQDCDWKGNSLDVFMAQFAVEAKARGSMCVLIEMPSLQPQNLEQQLAQRFFPYLVMIKPEEITSYSLNQQGQLDSIEITASMMVNNKYELVTRGWNTTSWWVNLNGQRLQGDDHNLGVCPILAFSEGNSFPACGDFAQIADISRRLYNMASELDEILRGSTFSLLTYQIPLEQQGSLDVTKLSESVGSSNMMIYSGNQAPSFATPASGPAEIYLKTIAALEEKIKQVAMEVNLGNTAESGVALNIRFQSLNAALATYARLLEDLERRMFDIACRWLKIQNDVTVSYPKSFEISDLAAEMLLLSSYQSAQFPAEVIQAKQKQIVNLDFANLEADELQALIDAVESVDAETPLMESRLALLEAQLTNNSDTQLQDNLPMDNQNSMDNQMTKEVA